jgi:hypothetical protein
MSSLYKLFLLSALILLSTVKLFSQNNANLTYIIVRMEERRDIPNKKYYISINAEATNPHAQKIYDLIWYDGSKKGITNSGRFYNAHSDTTTKVYNYFQNSTEALQFLVEDKWVLVTAFSEIVSSTPISSATVYVFKKEITTKD